MDYTIHEERLYSEADELIYQAILKAIDGLQGKVLEQKREENYVKCQFNKTIHGKVLGDRTQLLVHMRTQDNQHLVHVELYPINPVGQKLVFGARKGVTKTVMGWFWAHLEHQLSAISEK